MKKRRDDFNSTTKNKLAGRVAYICSNPSCRKLTIGPNSKGGVNNIGIASHICAAAPKGPRYNPKMTSDERKNISNGIWLCQSCSKLIDSDEKIYSVELLQRWKEEAENITNYNFGERINLNSNNKLEYIFETLRNPNNWERIQEDYKIGYYNKDNPSYMIEIVDDDNFNTEFYSYLMANENTSFSILYLKYNSTCIYSTQVVSLDSRRLTTIVPLSGYVKIDNKTFKYKYFTKGCKELILRDFLYNFKKDFDNSEETEAMNNLNEIVTIYENDEERRIFESKFLSNLTEKDLTEYYDKYDCHGDNELEIKINKLSIALGRYIKNKYKNNIKLA